MHLLEREVAAHSAELASARVDKPQPEELVEAARRQLADA